MLKKLRTNNREVVLVGKIEEITVSITSEEKEGIFELLGLDNGLLPEGQYRIKIEAAGLGDSVPESSTNMTVVKETISGDGLNVAEAEIPEYLTITNRELNVLANDDRFASNTKQFHPGTRAGYGKLNLNKRFIHRSQATSA